MEAFWVKADTITFRKSTSIRLPNNCDIIYKLDEIFNDEKWKINSPWRTLKTPIRIIFLPFPTTRTSTYTPSINQQWLLYWRINSWKYESMCHKCAELNSKFVGCGAPWRTIDERWWSRKLCPKAKVKNDCVHFPSSFRMCSENTRDCYDVGRLVLDSGCNVNERGERDH